MSYTLITANRNYSSWSLRPWMLMKALGIPFVDRLEPFAHSVNYAAFRAFSPTGQVPVLMDESRTAWDSLGITLYLADRHAGVWPQDEDARAFAQCAVAEMHSGFSTLRNECPMNVGVRVEQDLPSPSLNRDIARLAELWGEGLKRFGGPYLAGPAFTAADAFYAPVAFRVRTYALDVGPAARKWVDHILAHPAMQEWEAAALAETWREESHEAEVGAAGRIIQDDRA
ncbi:Glutathione S-transferase [Sphingobium herbicidovorans NBRC 16415]|uniref:Glutathione S-transferase n=1 Tax=Sphingobium herbicidovorans (strain ATCC 700291 / DSM 11019 / CCUG 56400 / KCTC 2939 / LMG 18315 / NBRC 16415 / MH) TaxID=1219045 RepID=A0A086P717_SPHHM|nr:glutathione S-transferase family protein [Sphingobium herbicidovorans]KFG89185.1 Glutathione S-transferase [Sphingobium herbicidovorans NBRC 16415]